VRSRWPTLILYSLSMLVSLHAQVFPMLIIR
jgi:hypothetical protein